MSAPDKPKWTAQWWIGEGDIPPHVLHPTMPRRAVSPRPTQGPWTLLPEEPGVPYLRVRGTRLGQLYKIANVLLPSAIDTQGIEEARRNARLIAAAPKLLAAAEAYLDTRRELGLSCDPRSVSELRAAVAEATGAGS